MAGKGEAGDSQPVVGTVAERHLAARLAAAEEDLSRRLRRESDRGERRLLVGAIAKGLARASAAAAPVVGLARLDFDGVGAALRDLGLVHGDSSVCLHRR